MSLHTGTHTLGPASGRLTLKTGRSGAAAKAGHDLTIDVTAWQATVQVGEQIAMALEADATSLRVREGSGGMQALGDEDKANIEQTINDDVLKRQDIAFHSTEVRSHDDGALTVSGDLTLFGSTQPISFDLQLGDGGELLGSAIVRHSQWGVKPYSALFGALKVADEVEVSIDARVPAT